MGLRNRLLALPQELYDEIFELTFALDTTKIVKVDVSCKPPFQLHINRAIRERYGKQYYGSAAGFKFNVCYYGWGILRKWLCSLTSDSQMALQRIEVLTGVSNYSISVLQMRNMAADYLESIEGMLKYRKICLGMRIFHIDGRERKSGNAIWVSLKNLWS